MCGVGRDVCVDGGIAALGEPTRPAFVVAPRLEREPGKSRWYSKRSTRSPAAGPILTRSTIPWPAQRNGRLVEEQIDVNRPVLLAVPALLRLRNDTDNRRVALGERRLVGQVGARDWGKAERGHGEQPEQCQAGQTGTRPAHPSGFDAKRCIPRFWDTNLAAS